MDATGTTVEATVDMLRTRTPYSYLFALGVIESISEDQRATADDKIRRIKNVLAALVVILDEDDTRSMTGPLQITFTANGAAKLAALRSERADGEAKS